MKKLKALAIGKLTILLFFQFLKSFIEDIMALLENNPLNNQAWLKRFSTSFIPEFNTLDRAVTQIRKNDETAKIADADDDRDFTVSAFGHALFAAGKTKDKAKLEAHASLTTLFETFKGFTMASLNYEEQTAAMHNFLQEAQDSEKKYEAFVELLGLRPLIEDMLTAHLAFVKLTAGRRNEIAAQEVFNMKTLRRKLTEEYNDLAEYVLAMAKFHPEEPLYGKMLDIINQIRKYYADGLATKAGVAAAAKAKAEVLAMNE